MPTADEIYTLADELLHYRGNVTSADLMRFKVVYDDAKIHIEGFYPFNPKDTYTSNEPRFIRLIISIKLKADERPPELPFPLPEKIQDKEETIVYYWLKKPSFHRPGRWVSYLEAQVKQLRHRVEKTAELNNQPIDDDNLFSF